jgi:hypothetical protein
MLSAQKKNQLGAASAAQLLAESQVECFALQELLKNAVSSNGQGNTRITPVCWCFIV